MNVILQEVLGLGGKDAQTIVNTVFLISFCIPPVFIGFYFVRLRPIEQRTRREWENTMIKQFEDFMTELEERINIRTEHQNQFFEKIMNVQNALIAQRQDSLEKLVAQNLAMQKQIINMVDNKS